MDQQQFCLRWHNFQSNLLSSLPQFLNGDDLTDVTLSAGGQNVRAHRVVLSASSQYFKEIFKELQPLQHPVIVLPGMNFKDLCALLTFMYSGEVNIYQEQLPALLSMADMLHIRGLAEVQGSEKREATASTWKRPSPNHVVLQNSTNDGNLFKSPNLASEPKSYKDLNENNTTVPADSEILASYYGPFDDSSLKMMREGKIGRKPRRTLPPPTTNWPNYINQVPPFRYQEDVEAAQDLSKVRDGEVGESRDQELGADIVSDADPITVAMDIKADVQSPESDDSGGGCLLDGYGGTLAKGMGQSKVFATCPVCKKQLSNQYNLRVHLETHQNMQYSCNVCSHVSRSRDALRKHVSYRHPVEGRETNKKTKIDGNKRPKLEEGAPGVDVGREEQQPTPVMLSPLSMASP